MDRSAKLLGLVLTLPLTGCLNAQTYGTPRTLGPGKIQTNVGVDFQTYSSKSLTNALDPESDDGFARDEAGELIKARKRSATVLTPLLPSVGVRMGAVEGFDVGLRLSSGSAIDLNGKVNFLRSRYFDMAVMPGVQFIRVTGENNPFADNSGQGFFLHLPILMGINVTPTSTILLNTGGAYMRTSSDATDARNIASEAYGDPGLPDFADEGKDPENPTKTPIEKKARVPVGRSAAFIRAGLGFNQRIGRSLSIQPEISLLISPDDVATQIMQFGIGFNIGAQPAYVRGKSDEWSEDEAVDRPEAADRSEGKADVDPEIEPGKVKPAKIKVEQDPYELEKEKKAAEEKKKLEEEEAAAKAEEERKAAEEAEKKKKKRKK